MWVARENPRTISRRQAKNHPASGGPKVTANPKTEASKKCECAALLQRALQPLAALSQLLLERLHLLGQRVQLTLADVRSLGRFRHGLVGRAVRASDRRPDRNRRIPELVFCGH